MPTAVDTDSPTTTRTDAEARYFPAYGPIEAAFGFWLFYYLVDASIPTVVAVFSDVLDVSPSVVGLGLAVALWFVLTVTVVDQFRRQLAALGIGSYDPTWRHLRNRATPSEFWTLAYLAGLLIGAVLAVWTFDVAIATAISLIRVVATLDIAAFDLDSFLVLVVFFISYSVATRSLDRLAIGGIRWMLAE